MSAPPDFAGDLRDTVLHAFGELRAIPPTEATTTLAPGKWAPIEVMGHLIDSASNNHGRFVRAQLQDDLRFSGYDQEGWVRTQQWIDADWTEVLGLWKAFNLQIARLMAVTPPEVLKRPRSDHNLDQLAWETVPAEQPATLEYFMRDYVGHLKHHLRQIDSGLAAPPEVQGGGGGMRAV